MEVVKVSEFGCILVNGIFIFVLMIGFLVGDMMFGMLVVNLGYDKLVYFKLVFIGDMMCVEIEVIVLKDSVFRLNVGIVIFVYWLFN